MLLTLAITLVLANNVNAEDIANINITEQSISIQGNDGFSNVTFTIRGPEGFYIQNYLGDKKISMVIDDFSTLKDGSYKYELTATTTEASTDVKQTFNSGRDINTSTTTKRALQSGNFFIKNGYVLTSDKRINNKRILEGADQDEV